MQITKKAIDRNDERVTQTPFVRVSLDGGCDLDGCSCSSDPFITISDGSTLLVARLDGVEADYIKQGVRGKHYVEVA